MLRWSFVLMIGICAFVPRLARAQSQRGDEGALHVVFHADLMGRLAVPSCGGRGTEPPTFAQVVALVQEVRQKLSLEPGRQAPLALLGGNNVAPGLFGRGVLARQGEEGAAALAALFKQAGYAALALGHHDLGLARDRLERFAAAAAQQGLPLLVSNLGCDEKVQPVCRFIRSEVLVEGAEGKTAILATLSPRVAATVARPLMAGLTLRPELPTLAAALERLGARGDVRRVVLMTQMPNGKAAREDLEELARQLGQLRAPIKGTSQSLAIGVVLAGGLSTDGDAGVLRVIRQDASPTIVGSSPDATSVAWVRMSSEGSVQVDTLMAQDVAPDPTTQALLVPYMRLYCEWYGDAMAPAAVDGAMTRDEFLGYVLGIMRKQARAEIALLNRGFIKPDPFPLTGQVRRAELYRAMPYQAKVGIVRLQGADLEKLVGPKLAHAQLARLGIESTPTGLRVNGRPLDKARGYRVATIEFLASGGDDIFNPGALAWKPLLAAADLRGQVESFLRAETAAEDGDPDVDAHADFGPPASERMLWVWISDLTLDLNNTSITGTRPDMPSQGYNAPQLTRAEQRAVRGQWNNVLQLRSLRHEADVRLYGEYGKNRNQPQGKPAVVAETSDLLQLSTLYSYRGLRDLSLRVPRVAVPDPYARALLESEFTRPPQRTYRHAELTATVGAQFSLFPKLRVRGGPGLRQQLLAEGPMGRLLPLLEAGAILDAVALPLVSGLAARVEGWVDYVFVDPASLAQHQLKVQSRLSVPLVPTLFLTVGADVYASKTGGKGWASAVDTLIGLRAHFDAARQSL